MRGISKEQIEVLYGKKVSVVKKMKEYTVFAFFDNKAIAVAKDKVFDLGRVDLQALQIGTTYSKEYKFFITGKIADLSKKYDEIRYLCLGLFAVKLGKNKAIFDSEGKRLTDYKYYKISVDCTNLFDSYIKGTYLHYTEYGEPYFKYVLISTKGIELSDKYDMIYKFSGKIAVVEVGCKSSYINNEGKELIELKEYNSIRLATDGWGYYEELDGSLHKVNFNGSIIRVR